MQTPLKTLSLTALVAFSCAAPLAAQDTAKEGTIEIRPMPDWSIREEVNRLDTSMRSYSSLINSLSRASTDLGKEFEAYLKDPKNELLASSVERKMAIYAKTVMADFDGIISDQDVLGANFRELQRKLVAFSGHLGNQSKGYKLKLNTYRQQATELEKQLVELSVEIKENPPEDPRALKLLKQKFAKTFRRYRLQSRYVNGYGSRVKSYEQLQGNMHGLAGMFVNLHEKFNELIENLENERTYLDDSIRLQADQLRIKQIIRDGILGSEQAIGNVAEKLANLYNKVDAFSQVHERINGDLNNFIQSQDVLMDVTRKIDKIGTTGGGMQNLAADMDKAIDAFYDHRNEAGAEDDKLLLEVQKEKKDAEDAAAKAAADKAAADKAAADKAAAERAKAPAPVTEIPPAPLTPPTHDDLRGDK